MQSANMEVWSFRKVTRNRASLLIWSAFDSLFLWAVWPHTLPDWSRQKLSEHLHLRCVHYMYVDCCCFSMLPWNKATKFTLINNNRRNRIRVFYLFLHCSFSLNAVQCGDVCVWCWGGAKGKPWQSSETWVGVALFSTIPPSPYHHLNTHWN